MKVRPLPKDLEEKAIKELNEDPKRLKSDLDYIKTWLNQQHYIKARIEDQWLLAFLRTSKFSLERTKERIDMFYTAKTLIPEVYNERDPKDPKIQALLNLGIFLPLKKENNISPRVVLSRSGVYDPSEFDQADIFKLTSMIGEILMLEDDTYVIAGSQIIIDMKNVGISHLTHFQPVITNKMMKAYQEGYGTRIKGMFFIHPSNVFESFHKIIRPFLSDKLKNRVQVFHNILDMYQHLSPQILPKEYDGNGGTLDELRDYWKKKVEDYREWFLEDRLYKTDESKRPEGQQKTEEVVFGINGSFRKLDLD